MSHNRRSKLVAPLLALSALGSAQAVQAQTNCIDSADLDDAILYVMPIALDATKTSCAAEFSPDGFMMSEGEAFADRFRERQDEAWPGAFRLLKVFMEINSDDEDTDQALAALPEESLRPFVDGLVGQMIAGEIKSDTCGKIERGVSLLAPLPPENVSGLVTFIAELAEIESPPLCGFEPAPAKAAPTKKATAK